MSKKGFTIIELLVVIAILTTLAGMTLVVAGRLKEKAKIEATRALITKITLALTEYQQAYFAYPPSSGAYEGSQNLYYFLGQPLDLTQGYDPATGEMAKKKFGPAIVGGFSKTEYNSQKYIIDIWEKPLVYKNPGEDHPDAKNNKTFVDIASFGPDKVEGTDDDINNWKVNK
ncbi:MAG: prepilin-type N-terminal cleavage/methylation domain-containing protein [Planctomycetes bacterium]|nr:prepilin-type N-terminal cleavage/methylation domain-containing protein [Planctomycetota bacterium]